MRRRKKGHKRISLKGLRLLEGENYDKVPERDYKRQDDGGSKEASKEALSEDLLQTETLR